MKTAEEILSEITGMPQSVAIHSSIYGSEVIEAMEKYADQWKYDFIILLDALLESEINHIKLLAEIGYYTWDKNKGYVR